MTWKYKTNPFNNSKKVNKNWSITIFFEDITTDEE